MFPRTRRIASVIGIALAAVAGCGGGSSATPSQATQPASPTTAPTSTGAGCTGTNVSTATDGSTPVTPALTVPSGRSIRTIATVGSARELAALPNGDLLVGTSGPNVYIVPNAESAGTTGAPHVFATISSEPIPSGEPGGGGNAAGVAFSPSSCTVFISTEYHVWSTPYRDGDLAAENLRAIATVRTGPTANPGDGDMHSTTSVATYGTTLYAAMGSSCDGCTGESDPQRAAIWRMNLDGSNMQLLAKRIRNAIALAIDPASGHLWAGDAGQDSLATGHPYEFVDDVIASASLGVADYGWPYCEENHVLYSTGSGAPANCNAAVRPLVEFASYTTHIGAAFYPVNPSGTYALPAAYRGALLVTSHGSWHVVNGCNRPPEVDYVPMNGDRPVTAVNWSDPTRQWHALASGFQPSCPSTRIGRPTGIAVGPRGSVFVGDDEAGVIYRIR